MKPMERQERVAQAAMAEIEALEAEGETFTLGDWGRVAEAMKGEVKRRALAKLGEKRRENVGAEMAEQHAALERNFRRLMHRDGMDGFTLERAVRYAEVVNQSRGSALEDSQVHRIARETWHSVAHALRAS